MDATQSFPVPIAGGRPRFRDLGWIAWYCTRGFFELVRARLAFMRIDAHMILADNARSAAAAKAQTTDRDAVLAARIGYVLPRLSARLPWRSDCLIQAIAGQNWLNAHRLASEIQIGVERPDDGPFGAHAWLVHQGRVITGGDISRYHRLLGESPQGGTDQGRVEHDTNRHSPPSNH